MPTSCSLRLIDVSVRSWREYRCEWWSISICARATRSAWAWLPEVFEVRDDDLLYVLNDNPPEELREKVEAAVRTCPKNAISIED